MWRDHLEVVRLLLMAGAGASLSGHMFAFLENSLSFRMRSFLKGFASFRIIKFFSKSDVFSMTSIRYPRSLFFTYAYNEFHIFPKAYLEKRSVQSEQSSPLHRAMHERTLRAKVVALFSHLGNPLIATPIPLDAKHIDGSQKEKEADPLLLFDVVEELQAPSAATQGATQEATQGDAIKKEEDGKRDAKKDAFLPLYFHATSTSSYDTFFAEFI